MFSKTQNLLCFYINVKFLDVHPPSEKSLICVIVFFSGGGEFADS